MSRRPALAALALPLALCAACARIGYDLLDASGTMGSSSGGAGGAAGAAGSAAGAGAGGMAGNGGIGGGGGDVGSAGEAGAAEGGPTCTPTNGGVEACDLADNDCSGTVDDNGACPAMCRARLHDNHSYMFCDSAVSATDAALACAAQGMQVIKIDDAAENSFVVQTLSSYTWIGGSDAAVEGEWRWPDGELFWTGDQQGMAPSGVYQNFGNADPNDIGGGEDCAAINTSGYWADYSCDTAYPFVCEQY